MVRIRLVRNTIKDIFYKKLLSNKQKEIIGREYFTKNILFNKKVKSMIRLKNNNLLIRYHNFYIIYNYIRDIVIKSNISEITNVIEKKNGDLLVTRSDVMDFIINKDTYKIKKKYNFQIFIPNRSILCFIGKNRDKIFVVTSELCYYILNYKGVILKSGILSVDIKYASAYEDDKVLAISKKNDLYIFSMYDPRIILKEMTGFKKNIYAIHILKDGRIAAGGIDRFIKIYDKNNGKWKCIYTKHQSRIIQILSLPDGKIVSVGEKNISIWDTNGKLYKNINVYDKKAKCRIVSIAFIYNMYLVSIDNYSNIKFYK